MALLFIAVIALALGLVGVRTSRASYVVIGLVTLALSWYAFTK